MHLPTLKQLRETNPPAVHPDTAWIWGPEDEIGRLNLLTEPRIKETALKEITTGTVISLNWDINLPEFPAFGRPPCRTNILPNPSSDVVFEDTLSMNTQSGSQWDGFRHFGHMIKKVFYNNLTHDEVLKGDHCGIHALADHGIVGRGVLLDYYHYAQEVGKCYDPFSSHAISLRELLACAKFQHTEFHVGDILLIRSGYTARYYELKHTDPCRLQKAGCLEPQFVGIEQSEDMKTWLHDSYFAAVGGDAPAFEVWPTKKDYHMHEYLLALWGMIVGEMFDLEVKTFGDLQRKKKIYLLLDKCTDQPSRWSCKFG
ncbi:putative cyclase [Penicillium capsulatum]|uniref:Cyclase n=1 Tax=Penicillium capsulatum TaxID=69766 RepID=A0A9W9HN49_9EURO|nr:putative cyclase [Penicillium capsulatum]KAJ6114117.1 putative cyclase [Penicillium capsulatum]